MEASKFLPEFLFKLNIKKHKGQREDGLLMCILC